MNNIKERVRSVVAEILGVEVASFEDSARFIEDLGADSMDKVELVMALEDEFRVDVPDDEAERITTVQEAINCVTSHV
ncbi:acyl carrier protein [Pseudomonas mandelii]|uniref:acyl carrier protein n=1 Tax=Pseudomonas mandelii TaxID=75612 RepID=UPI00037C17D2|nr:acyl carrier protein [Pseudomonas mandelii]